MKTLDQYPTIGGTDLDAKLIDISEEVTIEKLIAWLSAKPEEYVLCRVGGRRDGMPAGCLMEEYVNDLLGVTDFGAGFDSGSFYGDRSIAGVAWRGSPLGTRPVLTYDALRAGRETVSKAEVLAMLRQLQEEAA